MRTKSVSVMFLGILLLGASLWPAVAEDARTGSGDTASSENPNSTETVAGTLFHVELVKAAEQVYPGTRIKALAHPEQGDFHWYYQDTVSVSGNRFNAGTFDYLSGNVDCRPQVALAGACKLSSSGTFPNKYIQVLSRIAFTLSDTDSRKLEEAQRRVQSQQREVVDTFTGIFGPITQDDIQAAQEVISTVATPLDYVISYTLGVLWSGATPPLSWDTMRKAPDLKRLLPLRPASGDPVLAKVSSYLTALGPVAAFEGQSQLSAWILGQLHENTRWPSTANGGMLLVTPSNTNLDGDQVRYQVNKSVGDIERDLDNRGKTISLKLQTSEHSEETVSVSINGRGSFVLGGVISFFGAANTSYNMNRVQGASAETTIEMTFTGVTLVPTAAAGWQQATNQFWYYGKPIEEAWNNWGKSPKVTGYNFISDPNLGDDGLGFGRITALLISNPPAIKITYKNADYNRFEQEWRQSHRGSVLLFGFIQLGSTSQETYHSTLQRGSSNSEFSLTFEPTSSTSGPVLQRTANVIGGVVEFPANPKIVERPGLLD